MQRRILLIGAAASLGWVASGCTTTSTDKPSDPAERRHQLDIASTESLARLYANARGSRELVGKSRGVLVFPSVIAAGLGVGGEYGEGELRIGGAPIAYYSTASGSFGLQLGAQSKAVFFLFMTQDSLDRFRAGNGWTAGADASVAVLKLGANGDVDLTTATGPVIGFVVTNEGLMANATIAGTKVSRLNL
jgi:lipid-binding SYLF domain-containing protein